MFGTDDYDNEWKAFMVYMHEISTAALKKRTRVESLKEMIKTQEKNVVKKKISTLAATVNDTTTSNEFAGKDSSAGGGTQRGTNN